MKARIFIILLFSLVLAYLLPGQAPDNAIYVRNFPGGDVGTKVANAQKSCNPSTVVPCLLVIDPSLAAAAPGTLPTLCSHCFLYDYRTPGSMGGNAATATAEQTLGTACTPASQFAYGVDIHWNALCNALWYQTIDNGAGSAMSQAGILQFGSEFALTNGTGKTVADLAAVGTAGTYATPASITTDSFGRVTAVTAGSSGTQQFLLNQTTCTPSTSTDADCTGTITLSPGWADTSYTIAATALSSTGAHLSFVPMVKSAASFTYNLSCSFNCGSYGTLSVDVATHHN